MLRAVGTYNPGAMVVFNVDFGHTDPQWVLPYGGTMTIDGPPAASPRTTDPGPGWRRSQVRGCVRAPRWPTVGVP